MAAATIRLRLLNGDPQGLRFAEMSTWNGLALAAPLTELESLLSKKESHYAGTYFLTSVDEENKKPLVYVGEGEDVGARIKQQRSKAFWIQAILFVMAEDRLNKAHIKYLEGRIIQEAEKIGRYELQNGQASGAKLSDSDRDDMEDYFVRMRQVLPVLGCNVLVPFGMQLEQPKYNCRIKGLLAHGQPTATGFTVFKGSQAIGQVRACTPLRGKWVVNLREDLQAAGILVKAGEDLVFAQDFEFTSPSAAAAVIRGGNANGLTEWRVPSGKTLKETRAGD